MSAVAERVFSVLKGPGRYPTPVEYMTATKKILEHYGLPVDMYDLVSVKSHFVRSIVYFYTQSRVKVVVGPSIEASQGESQASPVDKAIAECKGAVEVRQILSETFTARRKAIIDAGQGVGVDEIIARHKFFVTAEWVCGFQI